MNTSSNTLGMLIFTALAIAVFVLMALRPAVDGNTINFGVPLSTDMAASTESPEATTMEQPIEQQAPATTEESSSTETVTAESPTPSGEVNSSTEEADEGTESDTEENTKTN